MFCNTPVCLHCVHRQGLTRDCYGSCYLVDFTHLIFDGWLRTTCSRFLPSFALPEHTTPSTHHTHTSCTCHTNTNTTLTTLSQHKPNTQQHTQSRHPHIKKNTEGHRTGPEHPLSPPSPPLPSTHKTHTQPLLCPPPLLLTCDGEPGQFINVVVIFRKT